MGFALMRIISTGRFRELYENLYSSVNDTDLNNVVCRVDQCVNNSHHADHSFLSPCHNVSERLVRDAVHSLSANKGDETYDISSDHFKNGSDRLFVLLSRILNAMLCHGSTDILFNKSVIKPIPKNALKSNADSSNYRAISRNSIISKITDYIIISLIKDKITTSHFQFAYKETFSTSLCSFLVTETIQYYRTRGSNVYMLLLDATKAFDRVKYSKLFNLLLDRQICPLIIRLLLNMYLIGTAVVNWNGAISNDFMLQNGVKQGGVISPLLFSIYINPLIQNLNDSKMGCHMGNICSNAFAYADDVVILSPTCTAMNNLIHICESYAIDYDLQFNPNKCMLIIFADIDFDIDGVVIKMFDCNIKNVKSEKHLGHVLSSKGGLVDIDPAIKDIKVRTNVILHNFYATSWQSKVLLFNSQCLSLYGCQLWNLDDPKIEVLCTAWRVCCRKLLDLPFRTHSNFLPYIMNSFSIRDVIEERMLWFFIMGLTHPVEQIVNFFKNTLISCSSYMLTNVNSILNHFNIKYYELFNIRKKELKSRICKASNSAPWQIHLIKELLSVQDGQLQCNLAPGEVKMLLNEVCIVN